MGVADGSESESDFNVSGGEGLRQKRSWAWVGRENADAPRRFSELELELEPVGEVDLRFHFWP